MGKYLITWDSGFGENYEVIEADSQDEADKAAYEAWREEAETQANYKAQVLTEKLAEEYDQEWP